MLHCDVGSTLYFVVDPVLDSDMIQFAKDAFEGGCTKVIWGMLKVIKKGGDFAYKIINFKKY
jgi:hypothetical protein